MIVAIEGNVGAGKSSVLNALRDRGYTVIAERTHEWSFLHKFYENPKKYALSFQVQILLSFMKYEFTDELVFVERSPTVSRSVFAKMLVSDGVLTDEDMATYTDIFDQLDPWKPDAFVYLECPVDVCHDRAKRRSDSYNVGADYLTDLKKYYDVFFKYTPCDRVDSDRPTDDVASDIIDLVSRRDIPDRR
jgi:deoxyadenosine/deoxycytidine kinase